MTDGTDDRSGYIMQGQTWFPVSRECPECDGVLGSNGRIHDCKECDWWAVLE